MVETIPLPPPTKIVRWIATVNYRTEGGIVDVQHDLEDLSDLEELVERGPHWDTIESIKIVRSDKSYDRLTVEEAEKL